jgi:hypothetical protein
MPSGANCLPDGDFFAFGEFDFPHAVRFWKQGFRLCGGDQRALRSPSGLLRPLFGSYNMVMFILLVSEQKVHKLKTFDKAQ